MNETQYEKRSYLNEKQVAKLIGVSVSKLQNDRFKSVGLNYVKIGRTVRYSLKEIDKYMCDHTIQTRQNGETHGFEDF
jgi:predicted DNA-binding transcriptional regulator AlpA